MVFDGVAYALVEALPTTPVAPGWTSVATVQQQYAAAVSTDGTRIYVTHGANAGGFATVAGFTPIIQSGSYVGLPNASVARKGVAGAWCNGKHYAIGGLNGNNPTGAVEAYTPAGANGASGVWSRLTDNANSLAYSSAAAVGNFIYTAGGQSGNSAGFADGGCYRYDTVNNVWSSIATLPAVRTQGAMVAYSGKLYYFGGQNSSSTFMTTIFVYDIAANTWTTSSAAFPIGVVTGAATLVGSTAYVNDGNDRFYSVALPTMTVTALKDSPSHGNSPGMVAIGSNVYLVSGALSANVDRIDVNASGSFGASVQAVQAVTALAGGAAAGVAFALPTTIPTAPGWATVGALDVRISEGAVSTDGTRIYATHGQWFNLAGSTIGPSSGGRVITSAGAVDSLPSASVARRGVAGAFCNGKHYAIGGIDGGGVASNANEVYTPAGTNGASGVWSTAASISGGVAYGSAVVVGNYIFIAGGQGYGSTAAVAVLKRYDTAANSWATLANLPAARTQGEMVAYQGKLYYLGGVDSSGAGRPEIYVYDIAGGTWSTASFTAPLSVSASGAAALIGNTVHLIHTTTQNYSTVNLATGATTIQPNAPHGHGPFAGAVAIGSNLYVVSGQGTANVDRIDTTSGLTAYQANLALLKALVAA